MTQLNSGRPPVRGRAQNDIYTALLAVASAFVFAGTIYLVVQTIRVYGSSLPPAGG
jgi:hypothetical protein